VPAFCRHSRASPRLTTPAETLAFIKAERADFGAIAKAGKINVEQRGVGLDCSRISGGIGRNQPPPSLRRFPHRLHWLLANIDRSQPLDR
jgi:hypothetical protein